MDLNRLKVDLGLYRESSNTAANLRFGLIWDGTTRFSEVFAVIVPYVEKLSGRLQKRLVGIKLNTHSLNAPETFGILMHTLSPLPLNWKDNIVCTFDRAAVNYSTFELLKGIAPSATDIGCMSHTFSHVGEKAELPIVRRLSNA
jgi:hypothetical protein